MLLSKNRSARILLCFSLALVLWLSYGMTNVSLGAASVKVTLPDFKVTLNNRVIDNSMRKYPLVVYKDITYLPMTWYDSRFLGLESDWDALTGLDIRKTEIAGTYYDDISATKNSASYSATIPGFAITVNNKSVTNSKEQYPLLNFRGVTYFPLTWRFAAEEFGWAYDYTQAGGLKISNGNAVMDSAIINIPLATGSYGYPNNFTISDDTIYYEGKEGNIYSAPLSDPGKAKLIYRLPDYGLYMPSLNTLSLRPMGGGAQLTYHYGSAQSPYYFVDLTPIGAGEDISGHMYFEEVSGVIFRLTSYIMGRNNPYYDNSLYYKTKGDDDFRRGMTDAAISSNFEYGGIVVMDNYIYSTAYIDDVDNPDNSTVFVYKTNITDGQSTRVAGPINHHKFFIKDSSIYYLSTNGYITKADLDGKNVRSVFEKRVSAFILVNDDIYYLDRELKELYRLSDDKCFNTGGGISSLVFSGGLDSLEGNTASLPLGKGYITCNFSPYDNNKLLKLILDDSGRPIYQSGSSDDNVLIYKDKLYYINVS